MTNEQIIQERENYLASLGEEERRAFLAAEKANDILRCIRLSRELNAEIKVVDDNPNVISVNGEIMGYVEFQAWLDSQRNEEASQEDVGEGFFDNDSRA